MTDPQETGHLFLRRLLAWEEYEKLHIIRAAIPSSLLKELRERHVSQAIRAVPSSQFTDSIVRAITTLPLALPPSVAQMADSIKHEAPNIGAAWHALSHDGLLAEMAERLELTEKMCRDHLGFEPLAFTSLGAARREEQNTASMKVTADAARASAKAARMAARAAAASAKTAGRKQNLAIAVSIVAAVGTVGNWLVNWAKRAPEAQSPQRDVAHSAQAPQLAPPLERDAAHSAPAPQLAPPLQRDVTDSTHAPKTAPPSPTSGDTTDSTPSRAP